MSCLKPIMPSHPTARLAHNSPILKMVHMQCTHMGTGYGWPPTSGQGSDLRGEVSAPHTQEMKARNVPCHTLNLMSPLQRLTWLDTYVCSWLSSSPQVGQH